jgi:glycogen debranching enzyme
MRRYGDRDGDGYLEYERLNPHGLFHQGWKDGSGDHLRIEPPVALVEVQGYAYAAQRALASLAKAYGDDELSAEANDVATQLRQRIDRDFWMPDQGFFALALDGGKRMRRAVTSNPGHLLLCGAIEPHRLNATVSRLFGSDLWTPFGVRTHASSEPDFESTSYHLGTIWPHDNWFLFRGLLAVGKTVEAHRVREAMVGAYEELGGIPELYGVVDDQIVDLSRGTKGSVRANPLQAWASAGLLDMISRDLDKTISP